MRNSQRVRRPQAPPPSVAPRPHIDAMRLPKPAPPHNEDGLAPNTSTPAVVSRGSLLTPTGTRRRGRCKPRLPRSEQSDRRGPPASGRAASRRRPDSPPEAVPGGPRPVQLGTSRAPRCARVPGPGRPAPCLPANRRALPAESSDRDFSRPGSRAGRGGPSADTAPASSLGGRGGPGPAGTARASRSVFSLLAVTEPAPASVGLPPAGLAT